MFHRFSLKLGQLLLVLAFLAALFTTVQAQETQPWLDKSLPAEERARLLVAVMTLSEKIAMVHGDAAGADRGFVGHVSGIPRLGIPELNMKDGPAGVGNGAVNVTGFPAPITVASTWDVALMEKYGIYMAEEQRGKGVNVHLAPMMNINRIPQAGRNFEGYSEDPYLSARMAEVAVRGIQSTGLIAVAKHYIGNEQEFQRTSASSEIDLRTMHEIYLPPFKASVDAGVLSIMCSYNKVNGIYACENPATQNVILKGELGFKGWVMSDWGATHSAVAAALGGLDMEMPSGGFYGAALKASVQKGLVPESQLNAMVQRILTSMFQAGLFDRAPVGDANADVQTDEHTAFTRNAAAQSLVLLKNDKNLLPIDPKKIRSIAVLGSVADVDPIIVGGGSGHVNTPYAISALQGITRRAEADNISVQYFDLLRDPGKTIPSSAFQSPGLKVEYFNTTDLSGTPVLTSFASNVNFTWKRAPAKGVNPSGWSLRLTGSVTPTLSGMYNLGLVAGPGTRLYLDDKLELEIGAGEPLQTVLLRRRLFADRAYPVRIEYTQPAETGELHLTWYTPKEDPLKSAVALATKSTMAIVVVGENSNEGGDRQGLDLSKADVDLIEAVARANPRTVVVFYSPAQLLLPWSDKVPAILSGWIPGQEAGNALADVLFGDVNPSGRLTMTFARQEADYPANTQEMYPGLNKIVQYAEGLRVGYRHFDSRNIDPLYPFGHGLSYTEFAYSDIKVSPTQAGADGAISVTLNVTNTGKRAGAEVAQLYLGFPAPAGEPPKQLKGFQKITLEPGESKPITFQLSSADFSFWSAGLKAWTVYPGEYAVMVGASSRDIRQTGTFTIAGGPLAGEFVEAESATLAGDVAIASAPAGFTGAGFASGFHEKGAAVSFKVNLPAAGSYAAVLRYASTLRPTQQNTPRTISLYVNGVKAEQVKLTNLANWEMWDFQPSFVTLNAGENTITYQLDDGDSGDIRIDSLLLTQSIQPAVELPPTTVPTEIPAPTATPAPSQTAPPATLAPTVESTSTPAASVPSAAPDTWILVGVILVLVVGLIYVIRSRLRK